MSTITQEHINAITLTCLEGISLANLLRLYQHLGSATAVLQPDALSQIDEIEASQREKWQYVLDNRQEAVRRAEEQAAFCEKYGIQVLAFNDKDHPLLLRQCVDAPLVLYYQGNASLNASHMISIVGTRRITEYGKDLCRHFCADLRQLLPDAVIVSGLAYGVDICSHRAALQNGFSTIGVVAHGNDMIYPNLHRATAREMVRQGGILTEYTIRTQPRAENFVRRNRIVAGMSAATIVVESAKKGGALITARLAQDYDRAIFAFPGRIDDEYSEGTNKLIAENRAQLITSAQDFVEQMSWKPVKKAVQRELFPQLTDEEQRIVDMMKQSSQTSVNQMTQTLQCPVQKLSSLLFQLEMKGIVRAIGGGFYKLL